MESIYFITADPYNGTIKMYKTINIRDNLKIMQHGSFDKLKIYRVFEVEDGDKFKKVFQDTFKHMHIRKDWYKLTFNDIDNMIESYKAT